MRCENKKALTLVELLTVVAIMALLIGVLLPAVSKVVDMAKETKQKAQLATIEMGLETFRNDFGDYPESDYGQNSYGGAQILSEALVGYDLFGVHPKTKFQDNGKWGTGNGKDNEYVTNADPAVGNLKERSGPYVEVEKISPVILDDLYNTTNPGGLTGGTYVLTDSFKRNYSNLDQKFGMPILYYKARANKIEHYNGGAGNNIFDHGHNKALSETLNAPWKNTVPQQLNIAKFYDDNYIANKAQKSPSSNSNYLPYNKSSFILISAGKDGVYGTGDDIFNFDKE